MIIASPWCHPASHCPVTRVHSFDDEDSWDVHKHQRLVGQGQTRLHPQIVPSKMSSLGNRTEAPTDTVFEFDFGKPKDLIPELATSVQGLNPCLVSCGKLLHVATGILLHHHDVGARIIKPMNHVRLHTTSRHHWTVGAGKCCCDMRMPSTSHRHNKRLALWCPQLTRNW